MPPAQRGRDGANSVTVADGHLFEWAYDADRTQTRRQQARDRFHRLSERPPSDEDSSG